MKKSKNYLVIFLVLLTIIAFAGIAIYCFYSNITGCGDEPSERLTYVANALIGLVGGIVASAFGVDYPENGDNGISRYKRKMSVMGGFILTGILKDQDPPNNIKVVLGSIYAWVYFLIGLAAIAIWILVDVPFTIIDTMATVSFGLILIIVKNYFP